MAFLDVDDIRMHYELAGSGPPAIAISGLLSNSVVSQWRLVPGLSDRHQLLLGDHRGGGRSSTPPGPYTIERIARDWLSVMDHLEIEQAPVLGNSMGGMVAQYLAVHHPERVERLVLSCTTAFVDPHMRAVIDFWFDIFTRMGVKAFHRGAALWSTGPRYYNMIHQQLEAELTKVISDDIDPSGFRGQLDALCSFDMRDGLEKISAPTLVIGGADDLVCRADMAEALAAGIGGAELVLLPGVGHLAQAQAPERYAEALLPFLAR